MFHTFILYCRGVLYILFFGSECTNNLLNMNMVYRYHPHFKNVMQSRISQLMGIDYKFDLMLSEDGSGRGAALVAAVLKREKEKEEAQTH